MNRTKGLSVRAAHRACVVALAVSMVAACSVPDTEPEVDVTPDVDAATDDEDTFSGGAATVYACPTRTLVPHDIRDLCGTRIVAQLFSGLVEPDPETGELELLVASSIETDDSTHWTITIEDGWTFHDGEAVTARSFVDAWNFAAHPDNELRNAEFFADIAGFDELQAGETATLQGLQVVDRLTFEVTLRHPFAPFLAKLSDVAFSPLPSIAYEDIAVYSRQPVGNGRYVLTAYDPDRQAVLERFDDWNGPDPGLPEMITFLIYSGDVALQTAYLDVRAGALDVLDTVPAEHLDDVDDDFGSRVVRSPTSSFTFLGLPMYHGAFGDNAQLRQALSLAIDREAIIDEYLAGVPRAADAIIPPVLDGHRDAVCDYCVYDPNRARELFAEAGGWDDTLVVHYNRGAGHETWMSAIIEQWRNELGIEQIAVQARDFPAYIAELEHREMQGPFRLAWALSYMSPEYALSETFRSAGAANHSGYMNPAFDEALERANASVPEEALDAYHEAEDVVLADLPVIPLWFGTATVVHSDRVDDVMVDATSVLRAERLRVQP